MKVVAIIQARMGSTRLPGKVMRLIDGLPVIEIMLRRLDLSNEIDQILVATSIEHQNITLKNHVTDLGFECEMGSEENVLSRVYHAAKKYQSDIVIRITGDCPFVDAELVDSIVREFKASKVDYCSNVAPATYPDGLDVEVFSFAALEQTFFADTTDFDKEHVTPYIRSSGMFKIKNISFTKDLSDLRWTLDEIDDFVVINKVFEYFKPKIDFSWLDILSLHGTHPDFFLANQKAKRNEGLKMGSGQKLYTRAKKLFPAVICFYPNGQRCSSPITGLLILVKQKVAQFGI